MSIVIKDYNGNIKDTITEDEFIQRVRRMSKTPEKVTLESALKIMNAVSSVNVYEQSKED